MTAHNKGITLIEILVALFILVVLLMVALPQFSDFRARQVLNTAVGDVLSSLDKAKSQSLNSLDSSEYGVHFESGRIVIFKGTAYSALDVNNEEVSIISPATISDITFSGGGSDIYFARLSGHPNKTGTVSINTNSLSKTITIGATGIFSSN